MGSHETKKNSYEETAPENGRTGAMFNLVFLRYFKILALMAAIGFLTMGYLAVIKPKYEIIQKEVAAKIVSLEAEYDDLIVYHSRLQRYLNDFALISETDKARLEQILPAEASYERLYTSLEKLIKERGLLLASLSITPDEKKTRKEAAASAGQNAAVGQIKVIMDIVDVDYKGLKELLAKIENNLNLMDVEKVSWQPGERSVTLEILTYYSK